MIYDLQKASVLKRISAAILDLILVLIFATGAFFALSSILNYDSLMDDMGEHYDKYEETYKFEEQFDIRFEEITQADREKNKELDALYKEAYEVARNDKELLKTKSQIMSMTLLMLTSGILIAILINDFVIPLFLKNGQTVGKKLFGICLIMDDGTKVRKLPLFIRALLGKFTIETMLPFYAFYLLMFGTGSFTLVAFFLAVAMMIANILLIIIDKRNLLIHDAMAFTITVDKNSQMIFETKADMMKYIEENTKKKVNSQKTLGNKK